MPQPVFDGENIIIQTKKPAISLSMVLRKDELETSLREEKQLIQTGRLKDDNPLDDSELFQQLCIAIRRGDLKGCQEAINAGANINGRDEFDYTPLILVCCPCRLDMYARLITTGQSLWTIRSCTVAP